MIPVLPIGTRIRFLKTLEAPPSGDRPAVQYAAKGQLGHVTGHGTPEGYWTKADGWPASFGAARAEFEIVPVIDENQRPSKPLKPVWGDYCAAARDATKEAAQNPPHRHTAANGGWSEYRMLMDAVWPDRGPNVTFTDVLQRAEKLRALAEEHLDEYGMQALESGR